jgi:thymidine kinase
MNSLSKLTVILGPMKAGKTTNIINIYRRYGVINKKVCIINHSYDIERIDKSNHIRTHDKIYLNAITTNSLLALKNNEEYNSSDIIIIDEAHFFNDLYIFIDNELKTTNKQFYVHGLSGDINCNKIGQILDIIPLADDITHFKAYCVKCNDGTLAPFTKTDENIPNQVFVGDSIYYPVCRKHYYYE